MTMKTKKKKTILDDFRKLKMYFLGKNSFELHVLHIVPSNSSQKSNFLYLLVPSSRKNVNNFQNILNFFFFFSSPLSTTATTDLLLF